MGKSTFCGKTFEPPCDVVSLEVVGRYASQAGPDVAGCPSILPACLVRHVDLASYPAIYELSNRPAISTGVA